MKTNYLKYSICLIAALCITIAAKAQTNSSDKNAIDAEKHNNYDVNQNDNGKHIERIQADLNNKVFKMELTDEKMTALYVDGEQVPQADWGKYNDAIASLREQIKQNREQALRNEAQARLNQAQAVRNQEQARLNEIQDKKNQEQAGRNREQAQRNELQQKKNQEQALRDQDQAQLNEIQAKKNQEQEVRNDEQAKQNELQAKKNQEQAEENERFMKQITEDLVTDKIISDNKSLRNLIVNGDGMTVNGVKQPDAIFRKYKEKYFSGSRNGFTYSRDGIYYNNN